jgi:hypothetical protein
VNKNALINKIIAQLVKDLELLTKAARAAHAEATHEQSKADNKYDTRGLEASYLARGQARQVAETEDAINQFKALSLADFGPGEPIGLSAFVELQSKGESAFYFVGPKAGGTEFKHDKKEVMVITPQSPLGQQLMGKKQGDRLKIQMGALRDEYTVASVK